MPAVSKKQERFMQAVAHNPAFAKKAGVPQSVGKEFTKSGGGMAESKKMVKKEVAFMKKKGAPKSMIKHEMSEESGMRRGGKVKKMLAGGIANTLFKGTPSAAAKSASTGNKNPIGSITSTVMGVVDRENKKAEAEKAHKQAVAEQLAREAKAKAYNARAKRMGMPETSPTGFDLPKTRGGVFKTGGKVKKMATGGMTSMYKGPTPPKTAYGAGAKSTPSYVTQAAPTPTKYANEAFDRSGKRAAHNEKQAQEVAARNARSEAVRKRIESGVSGRTMFGAGSTPKMAKGGKVKKMATGGLAKAHKAADGVAVRGKTKAKQIKMAYGGKC